VETWTYVEPTREVLAGGDGGALEEDESPEDEEAAAPGVLGLPARRCDEGQQAPRASPLSDQAARRVREDPFYKKVLGQVKKKGPVGGKDPCHSRNGSKTRSLS